MNLIHRGLIIHYLTDMSSVNQTTTMQTETRFQQLVKQHELSKTVADQLQQVLTTCEIVLLCDDSSSMSTPIAEEGKDAFAPKTSTRWLELKKLAAAIIDISTAVNPNGLDLYFLNRPKHTGINNLAGLQSIFSSPPEGNTNISRQLNQIWADKKNILGNRQLLIVAITDGEPSEGRSALFSTLQNLTNKGNVHVSFAECTDQEEDMEYLDAWDGQLRNFDNNDFYAAEKARVKAVNGPGFKFTYEDYMIKILLATFIKSYFNLDQGGRIGFRPGNNNCCLLL